MAERPCGLEPPQLCQGSGFAGGRGPGWRHGKELAETQRQVFPGVGDSKLPCRMARNQESLSQLIAGERVTNQLTTISKMDEFESLRISSRTERFRCGPGKIASFSSIVFPKVYTLTKWHSGQFLTLLTEAAVVTLSSRTPRFHASLNFRLQLAEAQTRRRALRAATTESRNS